MNRLSGPSLLGAWLLGAVSAVARADVTELDAAFARWTGAGIEQYQYGYNKYCECHPETPPETLVSVTSNTVTDVRHQLAGSGRVVAADEQNFSFYWTIDDLFALLETAFAKAAVVRAEFDAELGYPQRFFIDYDVELIGDELDVSITRFAVAGQ